MKYILYYIVFLSFFSFANSTEGATNTEGAKNIQEILEMLKARNTSNTNDLIKGDKYRTKVKIEVTPQNSKNSIIIGANSVFEVLNNTDTDKYIVRFKKIEKSISTNSLSAKELEEDSYCIDKKIGSKKTPLRDFVEEDYGGLISGPLIVPFKYRPDDKSLDGEFVVGYYVGLGLRFQLPECLSLCDRFFPEEGIQFAPYFSLGLSPVKIEGTTNLGFTWAAGILIFSWNKITIGVTYGQDRTGDPKWKHEGNGWISASVGWKLTLD